MPRRGAPGIPAEIVAYKLNQPWCVVALFRFESVRAAKDCWPHIKRALKRGRHGTVIVPNQALRVTLVSRGFLDHHCYRQCTIRP